MSKAPSKRSSDDAYNDREAKRRFEAALRGSREVGHKPMASMTTKQKNTTPAKKCSTNKRAKG